MRTCWIVISLVLLQTSNSMPAWSADIVMNGDFEQCDPEHPDRPTHFESGTVGSQSSARMEWAAQGYRSERCISVKTLNSDALGYWKTSIAVKPNTSYSLSFDYKTLPEQPEIRTPGNPLYELGRPGGPNLELGGTGNPPQPPPHWTDTSNPIIPIGGLWLPPSTEWRRFAHTFATRANQTELIIKLRLYCYAQQAWFDNLSVIEDAQVEQVTQQDSIWVSRDTTPPVVFRPQPPPNSQSESTVNISARFIDAESARIWVDGEEVTAQSVQTADRIEYAVANLRSGPHHVRIIAIDEAGNVGNPLFWQFGVGSSLKNTIHIDGQRQNLNGFPYFPIGLYSYACHPADGKFRPDHLQEAADSGFNLILNTTETRQGLDQELAAGVMGMLNITADLTHCDDPDSARTALFQNGQAQLHDHPAVSGYWADDPENIENTHDDPTPATTLAKPRHARDAIKAISPQLPTIFAISNLPRLAESMAYGDILVGYRYPAPNYHPMAIDGWTLRYCQQKITDQPIWFLSQGVDLGYGSQFSAASSEHRPTAAEIRAMAFMSIIQGVAGYSLYANHLNRDDHPLLWAEAMRIGSQMRHLVPILASGTPGDDASLDLSPTSGAIYFRELTHNGGHTLIAANLSSDTISAAWRLRKPEQVISLFDNRATSDAISRITDTFAPWEVHIYQWRAPGASGKSAERNTQSMATEESPRTTTLRMYVRQDERSYWVSAAVIGDAFFSRDATVRIDLAEGDSGAIGGQSGRSARVVTSRFIRKLLPGAAEEVEFPISHIPHGTWCFRAQVLDQFGRECPTEVVQFQQPVRPEWFGSDEAVIREVPEPWTPLQTDNATAECWGRRYDWNDPSLLKQAEALGKPLLASPIQIRIDGKPVSFSPPQWMEKTDDQLIGMRTATLGKLTIQLQMQMEFDGMIRMDWAVAASEPTELQSLVMEIPLRDELAKLFYQWRGKYHIGDDLWIGQTPSQTLWKSFRPYIWLGDANRGLSWFAESNANWHCLDPDRAIGLTHENNATVLRLHIISRPVLLKSKSLPTSDKRPVPVDTLHYAFGLQATPVKPQSPDAWDYRAFCLQQHTPGADEKLRLTDALLDQLERAGVRTIVVFEHWTDIEAHYLTTHQKELKQIVEACHARGMQVLLYFGFLMSSLAPEYDAFAEQSVVLPKTGWSVYYYPPQPVQTAWRVCLNSAWQDFVPFGIAHAMDEFGVDGVYLDGTSHAYACRNLSHGCGVLKPDGSIAPTFPIFAVRSAMKRIYYAVRSRKPDGQVNVHNSADMVIPSLAFATSTWDGEQFAGLQAGTRSDAFLPLDTFRTEFMGKPWGVPAELLCYGKPLTYRQAWALAILHDVPVRPMVTPDGKDLDLCASIWRAMDQFDRKGSTWSGYWNDARTVRVSGEGIFASSYTHPHNGTLIAISNLGTARTRSTVRVEGAGATDALTGQRLELKNDVIEIELNDLDFTLIHVTK